MKPQVTLARKHAHARRSITRAVNGSVSPNVTRLGSFGSHVVKSFLALSDTPSWGHFWARSFTQDQEHYGAAQAVAAALVRRGQGVALALLYLDEMSHVATARASYRALASAPKTSVYLACHLIVGLNAYAST